MINVNPGETVNDVSLQDDIMNVFSTGVANGTIVDKNGWVYVSKGGILNNTFINKDGEVDLLSSGSANATQIMTDGILNVGEKAVAIGTIVEGGSLVVEEKGIASDTTVSATGQMYVFSGGKIKGTTTVNDGGFLTLEWESIHSSAIIHGGKLTVLGGPADGDMAFLQNFTVDSGGSLTVSGSAQVSSGTITDAWAKVTSNGILEKVTLNAATVEIKNGALLSNADMKTGTVVDIASGGVIRKLAVSKGAVLTGVLRDVSELHFDGGTLDLNISGIAPGGEFLIGDTAYSAYISASSYNCTLTVDSSAQPTGVYNLIEDATGFDKTITVKDTLGTTLGTLTVGGDPLVYGPLSYKLSIDTTGLFVTVDAGNIITGNVTYETKEVPAGWTALGVNVNVDGILNVLNGGVASNTNVNVNGDLDVYNGGVAYETSVNANGYAYIFNGGSASSATVAADGTFNVHSGGTAEDIKVLDGGFLFAYAGATVTDIVADEGAWLRLTVGSKTYAAGKYAGTAFEIKETTDGFSVLGNLIVTTGGTAINTTVNKDKWLYVEFTGLASNTTVNADGYMFVNSGGTAQIADVSGGGLYVEDQGLADVVNVGDLGQLLISSGGVASNVVVYQYGTVNVSEGGIAGNVTVHKDGGVYVSNGATLNGAIVNEEGLVDVYGTLNGVTVANNGWLSVSGKLTGKMTFETGAQVSADPGAILDFDLTQTAPGADALVNDLSFIMGDPNFAYTLTVDGTEADGDYKLAEGATGFDKTITVKDTLGTTLGTLTVAGGKTTIDGRDYTLTLTTGGSLGVNIDGGGGGVDLTGDLTTTFELAAGMVGSSVNILDGGSLEVLNGGFASKTTVNSNGDFVVSGGGSADVVTVNFGGDLFVRNGGVATLVKENGGYASVNDGATVTFVPNSFNGYVYDKTDDWATLHSGTTGTDLTVGNAARILVFSSGLAKNTTVNAAGALVVSSGGKADGMNVQGGGTLFVSDGGKATGKMTFETGATVNASAGATLDFDLTQTTPGAAALVNDLSFAISQPFSYTITVDGTEADGDYKLAEGATGFDKTITVVNTLGTALGTLTVAGGKTTIDGKDYTLTLTGDTLGLTLAGGGVTPDLTGDLNSSYNLTTGKVASSVNILNTGKLYVSNGALASQTTITSGGTLSLQEAGALASQTTITSGGKIYVNKGCVASDVTADFGGRIFVYEGGSASGIVAADGAFLRIWVSPNTYAQGMYAGSAFEITDTVADYTAHSGGVDICNGATANNVTLLTDGIISIASGGKAAGIAVASSGFVSVEGGGSATGIVAADGARLYFSVAPGTYAQGTYAGSAFEITDTVTDYTIHSGGELYVYDTGTANGVTVDPDGILVLYNGVTATNVTENGGFVFIYGTATVTFVPHEFTGVNVSGLNVSTTVHSGTTATDTAVSDYGELHVFSGGIAKNTTVNADGCLYVYEGGTANGVTVANDGGIEAVGKLTGKMTFETGAVVYAAIGAILDFDLTQTTPGAAALVNDLSFALSQPNFAYTLTVDGTEADGDYKLAEGATGFDKTITVKDTLGTTLGTLTVAGGKTTIDGRDYTLTLTTGGSLGLTVAGGVDLTGDLSTSFDLTAGMVGSSVNILKGGILDVMNDGFASQTTIQSNGDLIVDGGGSADVVTVNFGGDLWVWFGGKATLVKENGGYVFVNDGATVTFVPNSFGGYVYDSPDEGATIHSGTTGTDLTAANEGGIYVDSGGTAVKTTVAADGIFYVSSGGTAVDTTVAADGLFYVSSGGTATGIVAEAGAYLMLTAAPGTYAQGTYAGSAFEIVENATDFTVHDKVALYVLSDGTAADTTVAAGGFFRVLSGGTAADTTVAADGIFNVSSGGTATGIVAVDGAMLELTVAPGTYQKGTYAGSAFEVADTVTDFTVHSGGGLDIDDGGSADVVTVNFGGDLRVYSGGVATQIRENGGYVLVYDGATVTFQPNSFDGYVYSTLFDYGTIHSGTTGTNLTAANGGRIYVYSGGIADATTVNKEGYLYVYKGGTARDTTIRNLGNLHVRQNAAADGVTVEAGGELWVSAGGKLTGKVTIETGADVTVYDGAIVDFDLTKTTTADPALVNDLSFFGTAAVNYTLTVDGSQASGTYNLADGATGFDKTITVMSPLGDEYGTLTVGGSLSTAFADYTLNLSGGVLTLDLVAKAVVDTTKPVVSNVAADITAPTNGNVTVTADFTDNVAVAYRWFRLDAGAWQDYPAGGVVVDCNTVIDFMAIDTSGNESDVVTCTVTNIDKIAPTITAITPSTTEPAASVTVTANFADDVALAFQQFKIGDGAWQDYTTGVTVTENGTIYFKAIDAAGNETTDSYEVTNIQTLEPDTTKPTVINVAADITAQTNGNVTVTAEFTDNVAVAYKYYTLSLYDMWQDYPDGGVVVTENNTTVYFEAIDTSGNTSDVVTYTVTNIDKEAPTITGITPSTTAPAASVTVTATFSDNVALAAQQYKIGGGAWQNYVDGVLVTENALVTFKAVDTAGNETTATYDVTNISSGGGTVVTGDVTGETKDINTGMVASDVNVNVNGVLNILAGGVASNTTVNTEGGLFVSNGGVASQTTVNAGGELFVSAGGSADNTTVIGGALYVYDGGVATDTTLQDNGSIIIYNGGVASDTIAETDGWIRVSAGGVAEDVTVKNGGKLIIHEGGKITGKVTFEAGAFASAENNAIVDFNIYPLSPANEALVNNLSILQGTPIYTLTINSAQMLGTYNLANGASGFDQTITVQSILGAEVGTLTVGGGATKIGDVFYTLNLTGSSLTVTVSSGGETDTTKPVVSNVVADITTPTNGDVTVTASFTDNVAVASSLYRINSGDWQNYTGGVTVTENATVYFKAVDTSGNESDVVSLTVSNIDKTAPEKPVASANVTAPTNGSVNVTATFAEDSVQNEYSMDGVNWAPYPGLVKFDNNGTVYFRSTDEVGNISEVEAYAVTNIDKVPPAKPTASADITTTTSGNVTVTAVFSGDSAKKEFSLDGLVWQDYTAPLVFSANGKAYFRAADAAGNQSDIISYSVTNIQPATPDNAPDDSRNDWVYNKKTKEWNSEANLASFVVNNITAGDSEVRLDKVGSVEKDGKHNFVGRSGSDEDAADYAKIELSKGAALSFSVDSTIAGTFVVLQATKDKKGNLVTTQRQKISVKAGQTSPKKTTTIYLEAGEYFVGMEAKLPSAKKGDAAAYYNVNLAGTTFFNDADNGWNNTAYKLDGDGKEVKTDLNPELVSGAMLFGRGATAITLDTGAMGKDGYANWVGFSDATDYRMLTLENAANVTLSLTATGKAKLAIWQVSTNAKTGVISLKSKGSVSVKAGATGLVKSKFLEAGTYFVSVESTDAKKGGSAYYNVSVDSTTVFFDSADTGKNDELYDKKAKAFYPEDKDHHFVTTNVSGAGTSVQLDSDPVKADGYKNFVGYQDKTDYAKINLTTDGNLFFKLKTTGDATFTVYRKGQDKKGNDTLETIQTTKLKLAKGASVIDKFTDVISGLTAGEYYISMSATNTSTNAKGSVFYNVTATLEPSDAASLAMPETDSLAMTDALSFGQFDADALADISSASLAELNDKSAWQNLALA